MISEFIAELPTQDLYFIGISIGMLVVPLIVAGSYWIWPVV